MLGSDYSRYLPAESSKRAIVWNVGIGGYIASTLVMILGAAVGSIANGAFTADPVSNLDEVFATWFVVPYLLVVIAQLYAINTVDLYSSALSLQAAGLPLRRWQCVLVDTALCSGLTALAIFSSSFNQFVVNASLFLMVWIAPWVGVYLTDWALRAASTTRKALSPPAAVRTGVTGVGISLRCLRRRSAWWWPCSRSTQASTSDRSRTRCGRRLQHPLRDPPGLWRVLVDGALERAPRTVGAVSGA